MTNLSVWSSYESVLRGILEKVKDEGTTISLHGMTKVGGIGDQFRYLEFLETAEVLENVQRAMEEGYDAFLIGNIGEPGLRAAREITDMPVLGLSETVSHLACIMGGSFSFVTINEKFTPRIEENVRLYGLKDRFAGAYRMNIPRLLDLDEGFHDPAARARIQGDFEAAAERGTEAGAEVVVAAGGVVMALLAHWNMYATSQGVPILNGITALVKFGEMAVRLKRLTGQFTSHHRNFAPPPPDQIEELRRAYHPGIYPLVASPASARR
jgi:allantoin racemase